VASRTPEIAPVILERRWRRWRASGWPETEIETIDPDEMPIYGSSVAEGICPDLHDEDDLAEDGSHDRRPRRLHLEADGWLHCEEGCAPWRFRNA
jgi:hypothetical protein